MFYNRRNHFLIVTYCQAGCRLNDDELFIFLMKSGFPLLAKNKLCKIELCVSAQREIFSIQLARCQSAQLISYNQSLPCHYTLLGQMAPSKGRNVINQFFVDPYCWDSICLNGKAVKEAIKDIDEFLLNIFQFMHIELV